MTLRVARAAKVIGMPLTQARCAEVFHRLGFAFTEGEGTITVTPPSWRFDLQIEEDLIEEVARIVGYQQLPDTPPVAPIRARALSESRRSPHAVRHAMAALDYQETINYSFVEERWEQQLAGNTDPIRVLNPIAAPLAVMRSSLVGSLLGVLHYNLARRASRVRVFEVGRVFRRDAGVPDGGSTVAGVDQPMRLGALAYGPAVQAQWGEKERGVDFFDLKGDIEALLAPRKPRSWPTPTRRCTRGAARASNSTAAPSAMSANCIRSGARPTSCRRRRCCSNWTSTRCWRATLPVAQPVPRQQSSWRDIALVVRDDVAHDRLVGALAQDPSAWCARCCCSTSTGRRSRAATSAPASAAWRCGWNCWTTRPT